MDYNNPYIDKPLNYFMLGEDNRTKGDYQDFLESSPKAIFRDINSESFLLEQNLEEDRKKVKMFSYLVDMFGEPLSRSGLSIILVDDPDDSIVNRYWTEGTSLYHWIVSTENPVSKYFDSEFPYRKIVASVNMLHPDLLGGRPAIHAYGANTLSKKRLNIFLNNLAELGLQDKFRYHEYQKEWNE